MYENVGLSTEQIVNTLKNISSFIGCFPSNKIPSINRYPSSLVINTEKDSEKGAHWVAIYLTKTACYYFDSFGVGVLENDIRNFLKAYYRTIVYNKIQIQDIRSVKCGHFCIAFITFVNNKKSYVMFINQFDHFNLILNDRIVNQIVTSRNKKIMY